MSLTAMLAILEGRFRLGDEITRNDVFGDSGESANRVDSSSDVSRIYQAEDLQSGKPVALKILVRAASKSAEFRTRFQRDADIMCSFDHPNVVKTIASGITPQGQPYFAMELLQGQTLAAKIAEQGPVPPADMAVYLKQAADALDAAHARGIVHRDINPKAIMILAEPTENASVKLLDFGLAKDLFKPNASQVELTSKQTSLGNAVYLSPEQARGGEVDRRSDVYALGVTLYEALTGRAPFEGDTDFQILLAKINGNVPPFPQGWSDHPGAQAIEAVVLGALSKSPADRPATPGALAELLQQAVASGSKREFPISWAYLAIGAVIVTSAIFLAKWLL